MKLDPTIIGALIIGASIILGAFVYQYYSDYNVCLREHTKAWERTSFRGASIENALRSCKDIKR
ncbi:hypothetical protein M9C84_06470 [SAR86 cluster bacterium]|jgi:hypothetical protein|nr:hypothetical protein M9C84_06470 [SAR86 cluster bacterium]